MRFVSLAVLILSVSQLVRADQLPIQDPGGLLSSDELQVLQTDAAALPASQTGGLTAIQVQPLANAFDPPVQNNNLMLYLPDADTRAAQPFQFGAVLASGLASYAVANSLKPAEADQYSAWYGGMTGDTAGGGILWQVEFRASYPQWYASMQTMLDDPGLTLADPKQAASLQRYLFLAALFADGNGGTASLSYSQDPAGVSLQSQTYTLAKTSNSLTVGDYTFQLANGTTITQIQKQGNLVVGGLTLVLANVTLARLGN